MLPLRPSGAGKTALVARLARFLPGAEVVTLSNYVATDQVI